jgi:hypothetical protein
MNRRTAGFRSRDLGARPVSHSGREATRSADVCGSATYAAEFCSRGDTLSATVSQAGHDRATVAAKLNAAASFTSARCRQGFISIAGDPAGSRSFSRENLGKGLRIHALPKKRPCDRGEKCRLRRGQAESCPKKALHVGQAEGVTEACDAPAGLIPGPQCCFRLGRSGERRLRRCPPLQERRSETVYRGLYRFFVPHRGE